MNTRKKQILEDIERRIEDKRQEFVQSFDKADALRKALELIPTRVFDEPITSWFNMEWGMGGLQLNIPYDLSVYRELQKALEVMGWKHERSYENNKDVYEYFNHPLLPASFSMTINLDTQKPGAKCIIVPIEWETKTVVKTVDKICPEGHPELFEKKEDGTLEYIGDDLFPKPPEGVRV